MEKTIIGLFDEDDAQELVIALRQGGIPLSNINVIDEEPEEKTSASKMQAAGKGQSKLEEVKEEIVEKSKDLWERIKAFFGEGVTEHHARYYAEGIHRGGTLVAVDVPEIQADRIRELMENHNVIDLDVRSAEWRQAGWAGYAEAEGVGGGVHMFQRTVPPRPLGASDVDQEAFQLGKELGTSEDASRGWISIENEAQRRWEVKHPGTWQEYREIVRDAWSQALSGKPLS